MDAFDVVENAFAEFKSQLKAVELMMQAASADTVDEETRATAVNRQLHPLDSSTPLLTAERAANKAVAKLEKKYGPLIAEAMTGLLAIQQAKIFASRIEEARCASRTAKAEKDVTGVFPETLRAIEILHEFGASKWHWDQQSRSQLEIHADLLRWHAKDPRREMADNPWRLLDPIYAERCLAEGKLSRPIQSAFLIDVSTPLVVEPPALKAPSRAELKAFLADEVLMAPDEFNSTMGGVISLAAPGVEHLPMWERESRSTDGVTATTMDWYRIEVPRGPYVLLQRPGEGSIFSRPKPEWLPPYKKLRHLGVEACMTPAEVDRLQDLSETGKGSVELALKAIRHFTTKVGLGEVPQEHLTRFWLYLLVGRHHPAEIESLGPSGYFQGIHGPDPANHDGLRGSLMIVRGTASDDNSRQIWPHLQTPWVRGWRPCYS
ncbi:hypothetical protein [Sphingomonas sp. LHG3406-1]|uniref:hypothetical protein n=1 Tax=Sphingomonas sp. LHG3406-1 TaxID=2804617 RepID=UPI00262EB493|nr:hypothetical protein [Sphingomonas sp. LHG3406-1]